MTANAIWNEQLELFSLRGLSARLGRDPLLVQASSGNTSIKIGDVMWIKASGKWLIQAEGDDFLIPVRLARARQCLEAQRTIPETEPNSPGMASASIETAVHAVLPQKVVVHVHSVNAIAWAVRQDAPTQLSKRLRGLNWQWIPYTRSGADLASNVKGVLSNFPLTDVLVLGNHGLLVCGESCDSAEQLLVEVERCLRLQPRPAPGPYPVRMMESVAGSARFLPDCAALHALATNPVSRKILSGGVLYPCQAIFLPSTLLGADSSRLTRQCFFQQLRNSFAIEESGVFYGKDITRAEQEMLVGLANIVQRIDPSAPLRYLSLSEVIEILGAGGENYRRAATTNFLSEASISKV